MQIELSEEYTEMIHATQKLHYLKDFTETQIVEFAVGSYYGRKLDEDAYRKYAKLQKGRRLSFQGHACFYCKKGITRTSSTLDHLLPLSRGGKSEGENIVVACLECNQEKGEMTLEEYFIFRKLHK